MAIKNLICDLGGVWLPIDERRTLMAFAALTGANKGGAMAGTDSRRRSRRDQCGDEPQSRREATGGESAAAAQALAARLKPDILAYELGHIDDATLLSRLRRALSAAGKTAVEAAKPDVPHAETARHAPPAPTDAALIQAWNAMLLPFPEAHLPLLDAYGQRYRLFLLSNTNALHIQAVEQEFQSRFPGRKPFLQHFEKAYLSHELHLRKPQPEIYTHVLRDAGLRPEETLFIDDRAENTAAAAALGLHTRLHPANAPLTTLNL